MKTKRSPVLLSLVLIMFIVGIFAFQDASATQFNSTGTGLVPLTEAEKATMIYIREEEKLARDVYIRMYELWGATIFSNISVSEQRHMDAVLKLLVKYGVPDPTSGNVVGIFTNSDLQKLYDEFILQGQQSLLEAFKVGKTIEEMDISDLLKALDETAKTDLERAYGRLLDGSYDHLSVFNSHL